MLLVYKGTKGIFLFLLIVLLLASCKILPPSIKSLEKVKIERNGTTGFVVGTEAVIHNPNRVRVRVKDLQMNVELESKTIASIGKKEDILIKRNSDFAIPLTIEIKSVESVFSDLKSLFGMLKDKEIELAIKGNVKLRAFLFLKYSFPVQYKQKVTLPKSR